MVGSLKNAAAADGRLTPRDRDRLDAADPGLLLTRWESTAATLHYTPNRWLVLIVTFAVSARVLYGFWRSWTVAQGGVSGTPLVLAFGIPESLAAGGMVIGYYFAYGLGVRRRIVKWRNHALPAR